MPQEWCHTYYLQMIEWVFAGVCGPNDDGEQSLWDELVGLMSWWEMS
jgi:hypothetical protein